MRNSIHVWRIVVLLVLVTALGVVAQRTLRPESFGQAGHYRFDSLAEIVSQQHTLQGKEVCGECHDDILAVHGKDIHVHVECEVCHGAGDRHIRFFTDDDPGVTEQEAKMPKEYNLEGCLFCHRKLKARPSDFPQVDPEEHYRFLHVTDMGTRCIECHSPHEPLFLLTDVTEARIHPVIYECDQCHEGTPQESHKNVDNHPVVFVCRDCHPAVSDDFMTHEHSGLRCTACHLFHNESDTAGRIFKNGNSRFCLMCHEQKSFKDGSRVPLIESDEHVPEMADAFGRDPGSLDRDPRACLSCHYEYIHDRELVERRGVLRND